MMRYDILADPRGWTVMDLLTNRPVNIDGTCLRGLFRREASEIVDSLNFRDKARASARSPAPRPVVLDGPGPFELPTCGARMVVHEREDDALVLELETSKSGQPLLIAIARDAIPQIYAVLEDILFPLQQTRLAMEEA